jgi:epoxyqueuosine reductase
MEDKIKCIVESVGADVVGIGSIDRFSDAPIGYSPLDVYKDCRSVIAFGVALPKGLFEVEPKLVYANFNGNVSKAEVDGIALKSAAKIEKNLGILAVPIPCDGLNAYWNPDTKTARDMISMKHAAVACGLGQLGKSTILLNPQYGNRLSIGLLLTNAILQPDAYSVNICIPDCSVCKDQCPAGAIEENHVNQEKCRANTYKSNPRGQATVECNQCRRLCPMRNGKV